MPLVDLEQASDVPKLVFADKEVRVQQVIITTNARRGRGTDDNPIRQVLQVGSMDGELIAEKDYHKSYFNAP